MTKGRNAAKTFTATRAARFAETRKATADRKAAEVAAGTRRDTLMVDLVDVRDDDEVTLARGGFALASETDRADWAEANGQTFVRRFREQAQA